jgi:hypothetical protein
MLGHSAISQLPISTSSTAIVEIIVGGKPLIWVLTKKDNKWQAQLLRNQWVINKRKSWTINKQMKKWNVSKTNKWYKNN